MKQNTTMPSRSEAEKLFAWAVEQNPEPWAEHCRVVARAAETIASKSGLDKEKAYILGLFHDVGYYGYRNGKGKTCHIYIGYELMMERGYESVARICLSHSFPYRDIKAYGGSDMNCSDEERAAITAFLTETIFDDYDKLIQLCDNLGTAQGICLMEKRMLGVVMRAGFNELTIKKWDSWFALKEYFDKKCNENIYNLFRDEIIASVFG
jgi:hypothetical protein